MSANHQARSGTVNLAACYRPRTFADLTGQRHVVAVLRPAIIAGDVPAQLLFSGPSGLGKTTVARIVATAVLCRTPMADRENGDPCGNCASCMAMAQERHPDYIEFDAASHGGKDEVREIAARAQTSPLLSDRRVYVIDEAHGLTAGGGQAFLKLLEEPPAHVMFILCTTDPDKMLKTNRGRCTELELRRPTRREMLDNLHRVCVAEGWTAQESTLEQVLDCSDPELGVRGTVNTLQKVGRFLNSANVDTAAITAVLGMAPSERMDALVSAFNGDGDVYAALSSARLDASDDAIRIALLRWLRSELVGPKVLPARSDAADMLELALRSPSEPAWLDLLVTRIAQRCTAGPGTSSHSPKPTAAVNGLKASANSRTVAHNKGLTNESFITAVNQRDAHLGGLLLHCILRIEEQIEITYPAALAADIESGGNLLRSVAGRAGLPVVLRQNSA